MWCILFKGFLQLPKAFYLRCENVLQRCECVWTEGRRTQQDFREDKVRAEMEKVDELVSWCQWGRSLTQHVLAKISCTWKNYARFGPFYPSHGWLLCRYLVFFLNFIYYCYNRSWQRKLRFMATGPQDRIFCQERAKAMICESVQEWYHPYYSLLTISGIYMKWRYKIK